MGNKKIFILLPDGIGLRNFAYTDFYKKGTDEGFELIFWNSTAFDLAASGFKEIRIANPKTHPVTDILKKARVQIDLNLNIRNENDDIYNSYRFAVTYRGLKSSLKIFAVKALTLFASSRSGVDKIRSAIRGCEKKTAYYRDCIETLKREKPALVFCTNQRTVSALAPILAAQELGIKTATFIFSWDNLPKATLVLEPDYYFVWSAHMKKELLHYYPYINQNQVFITGTPQFESHTYRRNILPREDFFAQYGLDPGKKYICFSGDDITTSPNDPQYLDDVARAVRALNEKGNNLAIIFRRCPVDFSNRYDEVLQKHADLIVAINPKWKKMGDMWNTVYPTTEDLDLLINTITHTEMVINLGSSMVFDYISFGKPCAYLNYDPDGADLSEVTVSRIYNFVHFRSMPSPESVLWINSSDEIAAVITHAISGSEATLAQAQLWFEKINEHPAQHASERILKAFDTIISTKANLK